MTLPNNAQSPNVIISRRKLSSNNFRRIMLHLEIERVAKQWTRNSIRGKGGRRKWIKNQLQVVRKKIAIKDRDRVSLQHQFQGNSVWTVKLVVKWKSLPRKSLERTFHFEIHPVIDSPPDVLYSLGCLPRMKAIINSGS